MIPVRSRSRFLSSNVTDSKAVHARSRFRAAGSWLRLYMPNHRLDKCRQMGEAAIRVQIAGE